MYVYVPSILDSASSIYARNLRSILNLMLSKDENDGNHGLLGWIRAGSGKLTKNSREHFDRLDPWVFLAASTVLKEVTFLSSSDSGCG